MDALRTCLHHAWFLCNSLTNLMQLRRWTWNQRWNCDSWQLIQRLMTPPFLQAFHHLPETKQCSSISAVFSRNPEGFTMCQPLEHVEFDLLTKSCKLNQNWIKLKTWSSSWQCHGGLHKGVLGADNRRLLMVRLPNKLNGHMIWEWGWESGCCARTLTTAKDPTDLLYVLYQFERFQWKINGPAWIQHSCGMQDAVSVCPMLAVLFIECWASHSAWLLSKVFFTLKKHMK